MIKRLLFVALCWQLSACSMVSGWMQSGSEVDQLFRTIHLQDRYQHAVTAMVDQEVSSQPALTPYRDTLMAFFLQHMSYESLRPSFERLYTEQYDDAQLRRLRQQYQRAGTASSAPLPEAMSTLFERGMDTGRLTLAEKTPILQSMLKAAFQRLQAGQ